MNKYPAGGTYASYGLSRRFPSFPFIPSDRIGISTVRIDVQRNGKLRVVSGIGYYFGARSLCRDRFIREQEFSAKTIPRYSVSFHIQITILQIPRSCTTP